MVRLFGFAVACDFPLPGVPQAHGAEADFTVSLQRGSVNDAGFDWLHRWSEIDGDEELSCARRSVGKGAPHYLLRFPDLADFLINGSAIACYPNSDCSEDSLQHLLLDQVIPRVLAQAGHLVLHASAVQLPGGRVIAFLGESGWGKSTLAAALQSHNCRLLSDDCVILSARDGMVQLIPSYPGLRLNDDSIATLDIAGEAWGAVCHYSDKQRLPMDTDSDQQPLRLHTLYVMSEPGDDEAISIQSLQGAQLLTTLTKRSFLLDVRDTACAARQLQQAAAVISTVPAVCSLSYSRDYRQLPALCEALLRR